MITCAAMNNIFKCLYGRVFNNVLRLRKSLIDLIFFYRFPPSANSKTILVNLVSFILRPQKVMNTRLPKGPNIETNKKVTVIIYLI